MDPAIARERMVERQIAARGISDPRVLEAMRAIPRHRFVPVAWHDEAYDDRPLPIGDGQTISQPYMVAVMTEALAVAPTHRVLEIGTGSGYQTAVLAYLGGEVLSIERHPALAAQARDTLRELGVGHVQIVVGDGSEGWPDGAPFDRILVTAGAPAVPDVLRFQLAGGGRLVIPVGPSGCQRLLTLERQGDTFSEREGEACVFVPLIGRFGWSEKP